MSLEDITVKEEEATKTESPPEQYRKFEDTYTPSIGNLAGALAKAQGAITNGTKNTQGYGYKYMTLDAVIDIARKPLAENGISIIQTHELIKGAQPSVVTHTLIAHESGEWHRSSIELPIKVMPQLSQAQMIGVNCTYGRRYALQAICFIAAEEDNDASPKV